jgi:hypothetical protein
MINTKKRFVRYVNCPTRQEDENLGAIQFKGELYYRTLREVQVGEEVKEIFIGKQICKFHLLAFSLLRRRVSPFSSRNKLIIEFLKIC